MTGTTLVVLAAGRGSRMGRMRDVIHKGLLPLGGKAAISHIIDNRPYDTVKTIIVVGDRADEVTQYVRLAHPDIMVEFVKVDIDEPRHGPGVSARRGLLARISRAFPAQRAQFPVETSLPIRLNSKIPNRILGTSQFGSITDLENTTRQIQFALKFFF